MMNRIGKKLGYKDGGFTIIEVMIVLAVAGLIMAIVLVAIPQLQRSQRNTARRDVTNRIKVEIEAYAGNNNGSIPASATDLNSVYSRYLQCTGASSTAAVPVLPCTVNINGPTTGTPVPTVIPASQTLGSAQQGVQDRIRYQTGTRCNGETVEASAGNRNYSMTMDLEGGAVYCVDNN